MIKAYQKILNRILVAIDILVIILAIILAFYLKFNSGLFGYGDNHLPISIYLKGLILLIPTHVFINYLFDLYTPQRGKRFYLEVIGIFKAVSWTILLVMSALFFVKEIHISRSVIGLFGLMDFVLMTAHRYALRLVLRSIRAQGFNKKHLLIIGAGSLAEEFIKKANLHKEFGYSVIGLLDDDGNKHGKIVGDSQVLGEIDKLPSIIQNQDIDEVVIALPLRAYDRLNFIINTCEDIGVRAKIIPDYFDYIPARPKVHDFDGMPLINIRDIPLEELANKLSKRTFDVVFSASALIILSPMMAAIALGVKLSSPGPVLFVQERVGLNRQLFKMYKFRTMQVNGGNKSNGWTVAGDPRRTAFGTFLRRTSLDELPQFFNVLIGDMSVIGPRPEQPNYVDRFREEIPKYMIKHHVRPGITGWAQVNGWRGDTSIIERIKCDIYYIENWRFSLDLKIVWLTILKGFINRNAY